MADVTRTISNRPDIPTSVQVGDFLVAKYRKSEWSRFFPWENWDHAALITDTNPLTVIEAGGIILQRKDKKNRQSEIREGVTEYEFNKPRNVAMINGEVNPDGNLWLRDDVMEMLWLKPVFPHPLREISHRKVPWRKRKIITESQAKKRAVVYARQHIGEPFKLSPFKNAKFSASKWDEDEWYCSLLIFKSYSRSITNMYLESYEPFSGFFVTPEDLVQSKRSMMYHHWVNQRFSS